MTNSTQPAADVRIALTAAPAAISILPGQPTQVWQYTGRVLEGDPNAIQAIPGSYLGPIIRVRKGQRVHITFSHELPQESIVHWHGLHVPAEMDGHPRFVIQQGETFEYEFEILNRAGTYWYHPHPHGLTGTQVFKGLAGLFLVSDEEEAALGLPSGEFDIPLVIQDRSFDENNQFLYRVESMHDKMMGFLGDRILVNGQPDFTLPVATRPYRLRILNGSNSRIYKLAWSDGSPVTVIGTDGGLLEAPVQRPYVTLAPGERVELWADFSDRAVGDEIKLQSLPFTPASGGMMGDGMRRGMGRGGHQEAEYPQGAAFDILSVRVERESDDRQPLPRRLSTIERLSPEDAATTRTITLQVTPGVGWTMNGRTHEMGVVAPDERVQLGSIEIWEFVNAGRMMRQPHPMHMHGEQFLVLERRITDEDRAAWDTVSAGYVDEGWKDTVLVMPGETVRVIRRFADFPGLFIYHCHNLEHEDMGMMRNFEVIP